MQSFDSAAPRLRQYVFLPYLDFQASESKEWVGRYLGKAHRLKFDVLALPNETFLVAAPAIAKCPDTAFLLTEYAELWNTGRLLYVLSPEYNGDFDRYKEERLQKIAHSTSRVGYVKNFEVVGYTAPHTSIVFNRLLGENYDRRVARDRVASCDDSFRRIATEVTRDELFSPRIARYISARANETCSLFQRDILISGLSSELRLEPETIQRIGKQLDFAFASANAVSAGAQSVDDLRTMNGIALERICHFLTVRFGRNLFDVLASLTPAQASYLSQQREWKRLMALLNDLYSSCDRLMSDEQWKAARKKLPQIRMSSFDFAVNAMISFFGDVLLEPLLKRVFGETLTKLLMALLSALMEAMSRAIGRHYAEARRIVGAAVDTSLKVAAEPFVDAFSADQFFASSGYRFNRNYSLFLAN